MPNRADALAKLARCAPLNWQRTTGLLWAEQLADDAHHILANRCWHLTDWLADIHSRDNMPPDQARRWRRLVDGLASAGDYRAAELQRIEE